MILKTGHPLFVAKKSVMLLFEYLVGTLVKCKRNTSSVGNRLRYMFRLTVYRTMVTDVSDDELRTPPLDKLSTFTRSPSVVSSLISPLRVWMLDFENEVGLEMNALLAEMEASVAQASAARDNDAAATSAASVATSAAPIVVPAGSVETTVSQATDTSLVTQVTSVASGSSSAPIASTSSGVRSSAIYRPHRHVTSSDSDGNPDAGDEGTDSSDDGSVRQRKRKPDLKSTKKARRVARQERRGSWDTDLEDNSQVVTRAQLHRRRVTIIDNQNQMHVFSREFIEKPLPFRFVPRSGRGYQEWVHDEGYEGTVLTTEDMELLFFNRAKPDMPSRVLVLLTIRSADEWRDFMRNFDMLPNHTRKRPGSHKISGRLPQAYDEGHVVNPKYGGPNIERNGKTYCIACGNETERFSLHVFCCLHVAQNGQHWCTWDGLCQLCRLEKPATLRARYRRFQEVHTDLAFQKQQYRKKCLPRPILNQHHANVEQVRKLREELPGWKCPTKLPLPKYTFDDFKPHEKYTQRIVVADAKVDHEKLSLGRRLIPQGDGTPIRVFSYNQLAGLATTHCRPLQTTLTTGEPEERAIRAWLKSNEGKTALADAAAEAAANVPASEEDSTTTGRKRKAKKDISSIKKRPRKRPRSTAASREDTDNEASQYQDASEVQGHGSTDVSVYESDIDQTVVVGEPVSEDVVYEPTREEIQNEQTPCSTPRVIMTRQQTRKRVGVTFGRPKNQLDVNDNQQTVTTTHDRAPPIRQERNEAGFDIALTGDSPQWIALRVRKERIPTSYSHGTGNIEYSADESQEKITESTTPASPKLMNAPVSAMQVATALTALTQDVDRLLAAQAEEQKDEAPNVEQMTETHGIPQSPTTPDDGQLASSQGADGTEEVAPTGNDATPNVTIAHQNVQQSDRRSASVSSLGQASDGSSTVVNWPITAILPVLRDLEQEEPTNEELINLTLLAETAAEQERQRVVIEQNRQAAIERRARRQQERETEEEQARAMQAAEEYLASEEWQRHQAAIRQEQRRHECEERRIAQHHMDAMLVQQIRCEVMEECERRKLAKSVTALNQERAGGSQGRAVRPARQRSSSTSDMSRGRYVMDDVMHLDTAGDVKSCLVAKRVIRRQLSSVTAAIASAGDSADNPIQISSEVSQRATPIPSSEGDTRRSSQASTPSRAQSPLRQLATMSLHRRTISARFITPTQCQSQGLIPINLYQTQVRPILHQPQSIPSPYQVTIAPVSSPTLTVDQPRPTQPKPWCPNWFNKMLWWRKEKKD